MRKERNIWIYSLILMGILYLLTNRCKKDDSSYIISENGVIFNPNLTYGSVIDIDSNTYKTIVIGTQTWMAENLRTTKFNDGTVIPKVTDSVLWVALTTPGFCSYNNTESTDTVNVYGRLYNWYTVNTDKLCPSGYHIPSDAEFTSLTEYLGGISVAGGKLKEQGTSHWYDNLRADNSSGFTALPGGLRIWTGTFFHIRCDGEWWSSSEGPLDGAWCMELNYSNVHAIIDYRVKSSGYSVRCVKD
jgi:uncharacterized protein (TIGR02145 family)